MPNNSTGFLQEWVSRTIVAYTPRNVIFETHHLESPLADFIESMFYYNGFQPDHSIERVVPTGHLFIIFELDGIERNTFDNHSLTPNGHFRNVWVSGMHKNYLSISAHPDSEMFVIQFKTSGAYPFLYVPIHQLNNKVVPATELFGDEIIDLRGQILNAKEPEEKFKLATRWLENRFDKSKAAPVNIVSVLSQIQSRPITESNAILTAYPNSQKHLINQFKKYFGLTPKVLHRIFRFNEILKHIQHKQSLKWTEIAYEFGYSDQSHFIKEFREFSGFNPQEFINSDFTKGETNFFPLDRKG